MQIRQREWVLSAPGLGADSLDEKHGSATWVLKPDRIQANFFDPRWMKYVHGFEHQWLSSLISSQCFAVNLFGPLADNAGLACTVLKRFLPDRNLTPEDQVSLAFEQTPAGASQWLGERGLSTQVDVLFTVRRGGRPIGFVLVEVKFTEAKFSGCRGWKKSKSGERRKLDSQCLDLLGIIRDPSHRCWMVEHEGRRYWELMSAENSSIQLQHLPAGTPCPFRHGLYQIMRNRVLADCMRRELLAEWADVAVCIHPDNKGVRQEREQVAGSSKTVEQFQAIASPRALRDWNVCELLDSTVAAGASVEWGDWMKRRYMR
jgi:hypothetical protein